jgi:hypothetical protein
VRERLRQADLIVEVSRRLEAALHNLAQAVAHARVARRAVDVEALLPALEDFHGHREGHFIQFLAVAVWPLHHAGIEVRVLVQLAAGHGVQHLRTRSAMVGKEVRAALRNHPGLVLHVLAAAGGEEHGGEAEERNGTRFPRSQNRDLEHPALFPVP